MNATGVLVGKSYAELSAGGNVPLKSLGRPKPQVKGQSASISKLGQIWLHSVAFSLIFSILFGIILAISGPILE